MLKPVIILGAGGHAKVIADIIIKSGGQVAGFLDDHIAAGTQILDFPILGRIFDLEQYCEAYSFVIGIGSNEVRKKIDSNYKVSWYTAVHPTASIALGAKIGEGTVIMANAVINSSAVVGRHCIINSGAIVEHDCTVLDYVHLSPNTAIGGMVQIGEGTHIGIGATVMNDINICGDCVVGVGAVIIRDITEQGTYVGIPVHKLGG
ncbi:MAG: acetyltransferase [Oscillospiraceae bacterium]|nr:acetyltransferase [Oscillospiraceae bacterium]